MSIEEFWKFSQTPSGTDLRLANLKQDFAKALKKNYPERFAKKVEMPAIQKLKDLKDVEFKKKIQALNTTTSPTTDVAANSLAEELKVFKNERMLSAYIVSKKLNVDQVLVDLGIQTKATTEKGKVKAILESFKNETA